MLPSIVESSPLTTLVISRGGQMALVERVSRAGSNESKLGSLPTKTSYSRVLAVIVGSTLIVASAHGSSSVKVN